MKRRDFITMVGGAAAWPVVARAQQGERMRRIGVLMGYAEADVEAERWVKAFEQGLREHGWVAGSTIRIDYRWATGSLDRMRSHAAELMGLKPDVMLAASTPALSAVRQETRSIPIVFVNVADPAGQGFISNLANPGGNITGFTSLEFSMGGKWIETLKEVSPSVARALVIFSPEMAPYFALFNRSIEAAGSSFAVETIATPVQDTADIERAINAIEHRFDIGLVIVPSAFMTIHRELIFELATLHRLPAVYGFSYYARGGGLVSYGINVRDMYLRAASYVDRILKGAKPGDLPVQAPTKFELVINLKTAKAIGLAVPPIFVARADEVIE